MYRVYGRTTKYRKVQIFFILLWSIRWNPEYNRIYMYLFCGLELHLRAEIYFRHDIIWTSPRMQRTSNRYSQNGHKAKGRNTVDPIIVYMPLQILAIDAWFLFQDSGAIYETTFSQKSTRSSKLRSCLRLQRLRTLMKRGSVTFAAPVVVRHTPACRGPQLGAPQKWRQSESAKAFQYPVPVLECLQSHLNIER